MTVSRKDALVDLVAHRIDVGLHGNPSMSGPRQRSRVAASAATAVIVAEIVEALRTPDNWKGGHLPSFTHAADFIEREFGA